MYRPSSGTLRVYARILRLRPAQLAVILKLLMRIKRRTFRTSAGNAFWLDPISGFSLLLYRDDVYEREMTNLLKHLLRPGDTFVDVGANEGYFSVLASQQVCNGRVIAVEPQTRLSAVLLRNLELNGSQNVRVRAVAISDSPQGVPLFLRPNTNPGSSGLIRNGRVGQRQEMVPTISLDKLVEQEQIDRARVMKVDCEGGEAGVVASGERVLMEKKLEFILMEYHPTIGADATRRCQSVHEALINRGYILSRHLDRHIYHLPDGASTVASFYKQVDHDLDLSYWFRGGAD